MVNEILGSDCVDTKTPHQSKGDVSSFYLEIPVHLRKTIKIKKFDADCIKKLLKIEHKIADSFFYIIQGGKSQLKEKWLIVENKGDKFSDAIEQLNKSLEMFADSKASIHGRIITKQVPNILPSSEKSKYDKLQESFSKKKGSVRRGNKVLIEKIISFSESEFTND